MKPLTIQEVRHATGARPLSSIPEVTTPLVAVCTDTRRMEPGSLFVALRGDRFNGNTFLSQAAAGGAVAAIVDEVPDISLPNVHLLKVEDTRKALGKLATHVRKQMTAKVVAVAGSNGKTSTKHLIDAALSGKLRGSISPKSFNNDIGVPLTIFPADPGQDYLVLEMGTNHPGEIRNLSMMALPDIGVITSIGAEHLEGLGDLMGVRRENAALIAGLNERGTLVINGDDPELVDAVSGFEGKVVRFGFSENNDLFACDVSFDERGTRFRLNNSRLEINVPQPGRHFASNALAALAVARVMRVPEEIAVAGLAEAHGPDMRMQIVRCGNITVVNDAYNANPSSVRAALDTLRGLPCTGRRIAVLGDMRELGDATDRYHREMGELAAGSCVDLLVAVGEKSRLIAASALMKGMNEEQVHCFDSASAAVPAVTKWLHDGDLVLLKASRSMRLEEIAQSIIAAAAPVLVEGQSRFFRRAAS